jgi:serine/threonine-protein kinase ATR
MYTAYERIIELCSPQVWKPEILLKLLCLPKPCNKLIKCIRVVVDKFGQDFLTLDDGDSRSGPQTSSQEFVMTKVGQKRTAQNDNKCFTKRQKINESRFSAGIGCELEKDYGHAFRLSLYSLIKGLSPDSYGTCPLEPKIAIDVLSLLCISLPVYLKTSLFTRISRQVLSWVSWIHKQVDRNHHRPACHFIKLYLLSNCKHPKIC